MSPVQAPLNTVLFFSLAGKYELYDESDVWNTIQQVVCACTCPHHILDGDRSLHSSPFFGSAQLRKTLEVYLAVDEDKPQTATSAYALFMVAGRE